MEHRWRRECKFLPYPTSYWIFNAEPLNVNTLIGEGKQLSLERESGRWKKKHALTGTVSRQLIPHKCLIPGIDLINRKVSGSAQQGSRSKRWVVVFLHLWMRRGGPSCHRTFRATPQTSRADGAGPHQQLAEFAHRFLKGRVRRRQRSLNIWAYGQRSRSTSPLYASVPCQKAWFPCHWKVSGGEMISYAKVHSHGRGSQVWGCWTGSSLLIALWHYEVPFREALRFKFVCLFPWWQER